MSPRKKAAAEPEAPAPATLKEYAGHRGISHQAVSKAIKSGVLTEATAVKVGGRWQIDLEAADAEWAQRVQATKQRGAQAATSAERTREALGGVAPPWADDDEPEDELAGAVAELELLGASQTELLQLLERHRGDSNVIQTLKHEVDARLRVARLDRELGRSVDVAAVQRALFQRGRDVRARLMQIPDRLAADLAAEGDANAVAVALEQALVDALEELTKTLLHPLG